MSLRIRVIAAVALALAVSLAFGCALAGWHAGRSVRTELAAALNTGAQAARAGLDEAARSPDRAGEARRLLATFDGSRHLSAALLDGSGAEVARSRPLSPAADVPGWFRRLIAPRLAPVEITSGGVAVRLRAEPANEVGEVWGWFRDAVMMLTVFCTVAALLVPWTVGRALRPVGRLRGGLACVEAGDFAARVAEDGPPELAALARGFNRMAAHLASAQRQNARLNDQLATLQEEERADLARDLHDEIGPSLFAVNVTAATIAQLADAGRTVEIAAQARAIQDVAAHVQRCIREILARLRPLRAVEPGLRPAVEALAAFWRERCSGVHIGVTVEVNEARLDDALKETAYRIVQEGMANAVRHGQPSRIEVAVTSDSEGIRIEVSDDGDASQDGLVRPGFGLSGMRERVTAVDGTLSVESRGAAGWRIAALLPTPCPVRS